MGHPNTRHAPLLGLYPALSGRTCRTATALPALNEET